jgi:hypothetical protein
VIGWLHVPVWHPTTHAAWFVQVTAGSLLHVPCTRYSISMAPGHAASALVASTLAATESVSRPVIQTRPPGRPVARTTLPDASAISHAG